MIIAIAIGPKLASFWKGSNFGEHSYPLPIWMNLNSRQLKGRQQAMPPLLLYLPREAETMPVGRVDGGREAEMGQKRFLKRA